MLRFRNQVIVGAALFVAQIALAACNAPGAATATTAPPTQQPSPTVAVETPESTVTTAPAATAEATVTTTATSPQPGETPLGTEEVEIGRIAMFDATEGWAIGRPAEIFVDQILTTGDGGESWQVVTPEEAAGPATDAPPDLSAAAYIPSPQQAWIAYARPQPTPPANAPGVWLTGDGGQSWQLSAPLDLGELPFEYFGPSDLGAIGGQFGWLMAHLGAGMSHDYIAIFTTTDAGQTWQRVADPDNNPVIQVCNKSGLIFSSPDEAWLAGNCPGLMQPLFLYRSSDGGAMWAQTELPAPQTLPGAPADGLGNRCGIPQIALLPDHTPLLSLRCFDLEEETSQAWLYTALDGGASWQARPLPEAAGVFTFLDGGAGWYLAADESQSDQNSRVYHTTDGGESWSTLAQIEGQGQPQIDFADSQNGWIAIGYPPERALFRSNDGGATWTMINPVLVSP